MAIKPQDYQTRVESEGQWKLRVTSYKLGDKYLCTIDNIDPGANVAKAEGSTREEAEASALAEARMRMKTTRVLE